MFAWAWARAVDLVRDNAYGADIYAAPRGAGAGARDDNHPNALEPGPGWQRERTDEPCVQHFQRGE